MAFPKSEEIYAVIAPIVARHGLDVEGIKPVPAGKKSQIRIYLDADQRPDLDALEVVSNEISEALDHAEERKELNLGAGYQLEVSTPGIDHPLTHPRHWKRNLGRLVTVDLAHTDKKKPLKARIGQLDQQQQSVILIGQEKKEPSLWLLRLADVARAVVEVEFAQVPENQKELVHQPYDELAPHALALGEGHDTL